MTIGEKIKKIRKENDLTQKAFADVIRVSARSVMDWENGKYQPQMENLLSICKEFNVDINYFLDKDININQEKIIQDNNEIINEIEQEEIVEENDIKGNLLLISSNNIKVAKKKFRSITHKKYYPITLVITIILFIGFFIYGLLYDDGLLIGILIIIFSILILIFGLKINKKLKIKFLLKELNSQIEYYKKDDAHLLSPLFPAYYVDDEKRFIIKYEEKTIINISKDKILDIVLYDNNKQVLNLFNENNYRLSPIIGMYIYYNNNEVLKIAFITYDKTLTPPEGIIIKKHITKVFNYIKLKNRS